MTGTVGMPQTPPRVKLAELGGAATKALVARNPLVLLPLGSLENQGPHAPVGDYFICERLCELIAQDATAWGTETFVAPALPFGGDDYTGTSPAGITLSQTTLRAVLGDMIGSLIRNGIDRVIVVNGHGGNVAMAQDATRAVFRGGGPMVPMLNLWRSAHALLPEVAGPETAGQSLGHGADPLTSLAMHLFPDLVDAAAIKPPVMAKTVLGHRMKTPSALEFGALDVHLPVDYDAFAQDGVLRGDPRHASAATGKAMTDRLVTEISTFIAHFARNTG